MNTNKIGKKFFSLIDSKAGLVYLHEFAPLCNLGSYELFLFSKILHERTFLQGEQVYQKGQPSNAFYLILQGEIRADVVINGRLESFVLTAGNVFGIVDAIFADTRIGTVVTVTETRMLAVSLPEFQKFTCEMPRAGLKILENMGRIAFRLSSLATGDKVEAL